MDVVLDGEELVGGDIVSLEEAAVPVLGILDLAGAVVFIVYYSVSCAVHGHFIPC